MSRGKGARKISHARKGAENKDFIYAKPNRNAKFAQATYGGEIKKDQQKLAQGEETLEKAATMTGFFQKKQSKKFGKNAQKIGKPGVERTPPLHYVLRDADGQQQPPCTPTAYSQNM